EKALGQGDHARGQAGQGRRAEEGTHFSRRSRPNASGVWKLSLITGCQLMYLRLAGGPWQRYKLIRASAPGRASSPRAASGIFISPYQTCFPLSTRALTSYPEFQETSFTGRLLPRSIARSTHSPWGETWNSLYFLMSFMS